jgi:hypothetical protein
MQEKVGSKIVWASRKEGDRLWRVMTHVEATGGNMKEVGRVLGWGMG